MNNFHALSTSRHASLSSIRHARCGRVRVCGVVETQNNIPVSCLRTTLSPPKYSNIVRSNQCWIDADVGRNFPLDYSKRRRSEAWRTGTALASSNIQRPDRLPPTTLRWCLPFRSNDSTQLIKLKHATLNSFDYPTTEEEESKHHRL